MKVLLIEPNRHTEYSKPPLGLLVIGTVIKNAGHKVKILDTTSWNMQPEDVIPYVETYKPDIVGITSMTAFIDEAVEIARKIKVTSPNIKIILGGPHATIFPYECFKLGVFDAVVSGEGENLIIDILNRIENNLKLEGTYINTKSIDLNEYTLDYSLLPLGVYHPRYPHGQCGRWTTAITSYGCPFNCNFCSKAVHGKVYRALSSKNVIKLIENLKYDHGIEEIQFCDDVFTLDSHRVQNICSILLNRSVDIKWECESHISLADLDTMILMKRAGCHTIWYGIESGHQRILNSIDKKIDLSQVRYAVLLTKKAGIKVAGYFMLGCPGESVHTIEHTIQFAEELELDHAQFSIFSPMPGSAIYEQYIAGSGINPDWHDYQYLGDSQSPVMMLENGLEPKDVLEAVNYANLLFSKENC